jgi:hypothetical protein
VTRAGPIGRTHRQCRVSSARLTLTEVRQKILDQTGLLGRRHHPGAGNPDALSMGCALKTDEGIVRSRDSSVPRRWRATQINRLYPSAI